MLFQKYDHWARAARRRGCDEWPEPDTKDVWAGKDGKQWGVWNGETQFGVQCHSPEEFAEWLVENDLPPGYDFEIVLQGGDVRLFSKVLA